MVVFMNSRCKTESAIFVYISLFHVFFFQRILWFRIYLPDAAKKYISHYILVMLFLNLTSALNLIQMTISSRLSNNPQQILYDVCRTYDIITLRSDRNRTCAAC